jgi:hypothetical protein
MKNLATLVAMKRGGESVYYETEIFWQCLPKWFFDDCEKNVMKRR